MPVVLALGFLVGRLVGYALLAAWWLLRALWAVLWRLLLASAALLVLAFSRRAAGRLLGLVVGAAFAGSVLRHLGGMGGSGLSGKRHTGSSERAMASTPAPVVKLRPVSAQRVATAAYRETVFFTHALDGPGLLSMLIGPAGAGKSEVVWGALRAQYDGEEFCGLKTSRPRKVLLLSEMGGETLAPALRRWGLYAEPAGRLDAVRLRLLPPRGAGGLLDVLYATDIYRPVVIDGELRLTEWPAVVEAVRGLVERGRYDRVIIDSLGEWMGGDDNATLLKTLGACRQLTAAGVGITVLHHTPRTNPKRPRGGTVIEAKLDTGYYLIGTGTGGIPRSRQDSLRELGWFKTRFPELTPPDSLRIERTLTDGRPRYRLEGAAPPSTGAAPVAAAVSAPTPNEAGGRVLAALRAAGRAGVTMKALAESTGVPRQRVSEIVNALVAGRQANVGGFVAPPNGGPRASVYYAVDVPTPARPQARQEAPGGHLRLVAPPTPTEQPEDAA